MKLRNVAQRRQSESQLLRKEDICLGKFLGGKVGKLLFHGSDGFEDSGFEPGEMNGSRDQEDRDFIPNT